MFLFFNFLYNKSVKFNCSPQSLLISNRNISLFHLFTWYSCVSVITYSRQLWHVNRKVHSEVVNSQTVKHLVTPHTRYEPSLTTMLCLMQTHDGLNVSVWMEMKVFFIFRKSWELKKTSWIVSLNDLRWNCPPFLDMLCSDPPVTTHGFIRIKENASLAFFYLLSPSPCRDMEMINLQNMI